MPGFLNPFQNLNLNKNYHEPESSPTNFQNFHNLDTHRLDLDPNNWLLLDPLLQLDVNY